MRLKMPLTRNGELVQIVCIFYLQQVLDVSTENVLRFMNSALNFIHAIPVPQSIVGNASEWRVAIL